MTRKETARKYVVRLSADERARLDALVTVGKHPARKLLKAHILLKADVSEAGDGWPDSRIAEALDTSPDTILRTRQRLVEEGLDAALTHKYSSASRLRRERAKTIMKVDAKGLSTRRGLLTGSLKLIYSTTP